MLKAALQLFVNACAQRAPMIQQAVNAFPANGTVQVGAGISSVLSGPIEVSGGSNISDNGFAGKNTGKAANGVGAGVFANLGPIMIDGSTISGNSTTGNGFGAGVFGNLGPITIDGSTISGNSTTGNGFGAGVFGNLGPIAIDGSTISGNIATSDGGGIWNGSSLSITNSLVTQNKAVGHGGGIFNHGTFTSSNTSVVDNTPDDVYPPS